MAIQFSDFQRLAWYYQALIVVALAGGGLALFWYTTLTPIQTDVDAKESQLVDLTEQVAAAVERQRALAQIKAESIELQKRLDDLKTVLPLERETDNLLRQVQQAATDSSLRLLRVAPRAIVDREIYSEWPIDMQVEATYHNLALFLDRIRQLPRIVNITGLQMSSGGDGVTTTISATYTATTFVYREEDPPPGN